MTKEELFLDNIKLAYKLSNTYFKNHKNDIEDIKQIALLGLWKAILKYDNKRTFSTFAYAVMQNEINYYLRSERKQAKTISLETKIYDDIRVEDTLEDFQNNTERIVIDSVELEEIKNIVIKTLESKERKVYMELTKRKETKRNSKRIEYVTSSGVKNTKKDN